MKINAVVFDLFGTLVDDFVSSVGQMNTELAAALTVPLEPFMQLWRQTSEMRTIGAFQTVEDSIEYVCGVMGVEVTAEQMTEAVDIRLRHTRRALEPKSNAVGTLAQLKNQGYKLGLLSNCSIEIPILWQETAFASLIDNPIFSSREGLKKPDPRIYHLACERLGVAPEDCLYVADGENHELKAAAEVGIHPVLIRTSSQETRGEVLREAREWQGDAVSTLSEVLDLEAFTTNPS
ncbi:MAG TPA: HAD-IA family hydrolase [Candidatus Binatia bacterium]|jgi:putative hydrolase of the HAD superfamily